MLHRTFEVLRQKESILSPPVFETLTSFKKLMRIFLFIFEKVFFNPKHII